MLLRELSSITLSPEDHARREPPRPQAFRVNDYEQLFDYDTVAYDIFRSESGTETICVMPPLFNLSTAARPLTALIDGRPVSATSYGNSRTLTLFVKADRASRAMTLKGNFPPKSVQIGESLTSKFRGTRAIIAVSKNNNIDWILDWARFNRAIHGADSLLLYDNGSTLYDLETLEDSLAGLDGYRSIAVVDWRFPYGPIGVGTQYWDSNFGQIGALQHARYRFLSEAAAVLNSDIDEFCVTATGKSIFSEALGSDRGYIRFPGHWLESFVADAQFDWTKRRHKSFLPLTSRAQDCPPKWAVIPQRCPRDALWSVHEVEQMEASDVGYATTFFRHFRGISTGWKGGRSNYQVVDCAEPISADYFHDVALQNAFLAAFGSKNSD